VKFHQSLTSSWITIFLSKNTKLALKVKCQGGVSPKFNNFHGHHNTYLHKSNQFLIGSFFADRQTHRHTECKTCFTTRNWRSGDSARDNVYGAIVTTKLLRQFSQYNSTKRLPVNCYRLQPLSLVCMYVFWTTYIAQWGAQAVSRALHSKKLSFRENESIKISHFLKFFLNEGVMTISEVFQVVYTSARCNNRERMKSACILSLIMYSWNLLCQYPGNILVWSNDHYVRVMWYVLYSKSRPRNRRFEIWLVAGNLAHNVQCERYPRHKIYRPRDVTNTAPIRFRCRLSATSGRRCTSESSIPCGTVAVCHNIGVRFLTYRSFIALTTCWSLRPKILHNLSYLTRMLTFLTIYLYFAT